MPWYGWVLIVLITGLALSDIVEAVMRRGQHCRIAVGGIEWCPKCHGDDRPATGGS